MCLGPHSIQANLEEDLIKESSLRDYVRKLQRWRDTYEVSLDSRPRKQPLDQANCYLSEFHHGKFDEVEIPGQYLQVSFNRGWVLTSKDDCCLTRFYAFPSHSTSTVTTTLLRLPGSRLPSSSVAATASASDASP